MLDLPQSTYFGRIIAKERVYAAAGADAASKDAFVAQVERIRWLHKISPTTVNIAPGEQVEEIQVIEVALTVPVPDKRILPTILKGIPYKIIFVLTHKGKTTYAAYFDPKTCFTSEQPPRLIGNDPDSVWENIIIQLRGAAIEPGKTLAEQIADDAARASLRRQIEHLETQARKENQPRRKWDLVENVKGLKAKLEET